MGRNCCQYFLVEHNGDVYPCDFFVYPHLKMGNIAADEWAEMQASQAYRDFGAQKTQWHDRCGDCEWARLCSGDCLKHRLYNDWRPETLSWLCEGWRRFYSHAMPGFEKLAGEIRSERQARQTAQAAQAPRRSQPVPDVGRNDPCPCGSGKKYKKCCGRR
jgi:uncharacterized protein